MKILSRLWERVRATKTPAPPPVPEPVPEIPAKKSAPRRRYSKEFIANQSRLDFNLDEALRLRAKGWSYAKIARKINSNKETVRTKLLKYDAEHAPAKAITPPAIPPIVLAPPPRVIAAVPTVPSETPLPDNSPSSPPFSNYELLHETVEPAPELTANETTDARVLDFLRQSSLGVHHTEIAGGTGISYAGAGDSIQRLLNAGFISHQGAQEAQHRRYNLTSKAPKPVPPKLRPSEVNLSRVFIVRFNRHLKLAWGSRQPCIGMAKWRDEYLSLEMFTQPEHFYILLNAADGQTTNQKWLNSIAGADIKMRERCSVLRVETGGVFDVFKSRHDLQRDYPRQLNGGYADETFEGSHKFVPCPQTRHTDVIAELTKDLPAPPTPSVREMIQEGHWKRCAEEERKKMPTAQQAAVAAMALEERIAAGFGTDEDYRKTGGGNNGGGPDGTGFSF